MDTEDITPLDILNAYCNGYFPMSHSGAHSGKNADSPGAAGDDVHWYDPPQRGIIPIADFHLPRSLKRAVLKGDYTVTINHDFAGVIDACAACTTGNVGDNAAKFDSGKGREETWINPIIRDWFSELHEMGFAHSVEYRSDGMLLGGLYGLCLGGAFFGESMFSRAPNASKIALVHLVARLYNRGFALLDSQFVNDHLVQFGCIEIPREDYLVRLNKAIQMPLRFVDVGHEKITLMRGDLVDFLNRP